MESSLKYSEAIRLAGMHFKLSFGYGGDLNETACANSGSCFIAGKHSDSIYNSFKLAGLLVTCPVCGFHNMLGAVVAVCLNDKHRWTFNQIADFVEKVEAVPITTTVPYVAKEMVEA